MGSSLLHSFLTHVCTIRELIACSLSLARPDTMALKVCQLVPESLCEAEYLRLQAREWREALRTAAMFERQDLVETTIAPQAADSAATLQVIRLAKLTK